MPLDADGHLREGIDLQARLADGSTQLHRAVACGGRAVGAILDTLPSSAERAVLLMAGDETGCTPMHLLARDPSRFEGVVRAIVSGLDDEQLAAVLNTRDSKGLLPWHHVFVEKAHMVNSRGVRFTDDETYNNETVLPAWRMHALLDPSRVGQPQPSDADIREAAMAPDPRLQLQVDPEAARNLPLVDAKRILGREPGYQQIVAADVRNETVSAICLGDFVDVAYHLLQSRELAILAKSTAKHHIKRGNVLGTVAATGNSGRHAKTSEGAAQYLRDMLGEVALARIQMQLFEGPSTKKGLRSRLSYIVADAHAERAARPEGSAETPIAGWDRPAERAE